MCCEHTPLRSSNRSSPRAQRKERSQVPHPADAVQIKPLLRRPSPGDCRHPGSPERCRRRPRGRPAWYRPGGGGDMTRRIELTETGIAAGRALYRVMAGDVQVGIAAELTADHAAPWRLTVP